MVDTYEVLYLPTDAGTIRLDIYFKHSIYHVQAELDILITSSHHREKKVAVKKAILLLATEHNSHKGL